MLSTPEKFVGDRTSNDGMYQTIWGTSFEAAPGYTEHPMQTYEWGDMWLRGITASAKDYTVEPLLSVVVDNMAIPLFERSAFNGNPGTEYVGFSNFSPGLVTPAAASSLRTIAELDYLVSRQSTVILRVNNPGALCRVAVTFKVWVLE